MSIVTQSTRLICVETREYPIYLREMGPRQVGSFPPTVDSALLEGFGYAVVEDTPKPEADILAEGAPELVDGVWRRTWETRSFTEVELAQQLEADKQAMNESIEAFRVRKFERGFPYQFSNGVYHVQVRTGDRGNISDLRTIAKEALAGDIPFTVPFRVQENITIPLNAAEMVALADKTFEQVVAGYQLIWNLKDQVYEATSKDLFPEIPAELFSL